MATHSSVLAWRIPGTGEPGGLPSMGLHRVGHDWSDLAAAAASLCLLVGAFNPFTFKVIIDIYVPIAIFLIVWVDFVELFPSLVFLDYISPFNICFKAGLVVLNSLNFCLSEKLFISPLILSEILAGYSNLGCRSFPFQYLKYILPFPSGLQSFCWKISC